MQMCSAMGSDNVGTEMKALLINHGIVHKCVKYLQRALQIYNEKADNSTA